MIYQGVQAMNYKKLKILATSFRNAIEIMIKDDLDDLRKEYPDLFEGDFEVKLVTNLIEVLGYAIIDFIPEDFIKSELL